jgi:uncharacterized OB-fold protein
MCGECGSFEWSWQPVSGAGEIVSWIRTHHAFLPGFAAPYDTVFVRLDVDGGQDDIVMPGTWFGADEPAIGMRVQAHYDDIEREEQEGGRVTLLGWEPQEA